MSEHAPFGGVANPHAPFEPANLPAGSVAEGQLAAGVIAKLNPSAWTNLVLGAKIESGGLQIPGVRSEGGVTVARFRGDVRPKAAEELLAGETLLTVPAGFRPPADIEFERVTSAGGLHRCKIAAATGILTDTSAIATGVVIFLDGFGYSLT